MSLSRQFWARLNGQTYLVEVDDQRTLLMAWIEIRAHDKALAMRKVVNQTTLARIQDHVRPPGVCLTCGQPHPTAEHAAKGTQHFIDPRA